MGKIYVMRHGESIVNVERRLTCKDFKGDLTEKGREQARKAGEWLKDKAIHRIFVSPFHRAEQTARIVGNIIGIQPEVEDGLREMDCGNLEGLTDDASWEIHAGVFQRWLKADWTARFPNGESYLDAHERYSGVVRRTLDGENTLLVTHGGITMTVLPYLCVNAAALQGDKHLDNTGMVVLEHYDPGRYACMAWNLCEHL